MICTGKLANVIIPRPRLDGEPAPGVGKVSVKSIIIQFLPMVTISFRNLPFAVVADNCSYVLAGVLGI